MRLLAFVVLCVSIPCYAINTTHEKCINSFTRDIYYRYYLTQRCQESVELLKKNPNIWKTIDFDNIEAGIFENIIVKEKAGLIQKNHTSQHFIELWHQMKSLRHVDDSSFHQDFIKLLFMIYKSIEQPAAQKASSLVTAPYSIERMLSSIDMHIDKLRSNVPKRSSSEYALSDSSSITTDDIALNYYLIQRLDKSIKLLSIMHQDLAASRIGWFDHAMCNIGINFSHERINYCFNQMSMHKNLAPFLHTWQEYARFRHAGDAHFLKEMLMMLFAVYKDLLFVKITEETEEFITSEMSTILDLYEHVNELPLDEILHAIDITTDKLLLLQSMDKKVKQSWDQQYPVLFHTFLALPIAYLIIKTCAL
jgi:hypothetical protein